MAKLNQIIAIEKGSKSQSTAKLSEIYKLIQKETLFGGLLRSYQPLADDGERFPDENKHVAHKLKDLIKATVATLGDYWSITARKDWTNQTACASIRVDGKVIAADVPVTYLLFLEKQLTDLRTFVNSLPVLEITDKWEFSKEDGLWKTSPVTTHKSKKIQKTLVLLAPTPEHPGQAQLISEDETVGHWKSQKVSGAIPATEKEALGLKVEKLLRAVKEAREEANAVDESAKVPKIAEEIFSYVFGQ